MDTQKTISEVPEAIDSPEPVSAPSGGPDGRILMPDPYPLFPGAPKSSLRGWVDLLWLSFHSVLRGIWGTTLSWMASLIDFCSERPRATVAILVFLSGFFAENGLEKPAISGTLKFLAYQIDPKATEEVFSPKDPLEAALQSEIQMLLEDPQARAQLNDLLFPVSLETPE